MPERSLPITVLALTFALAGCSRNASAPGRSSAGSPVPSGGSTANGGSDVVALVDGAPITASELEKKASSQLARFRQEEYEIRRQALDEMVAERLLDAEAAKRGLSREKLIAAEVDAKTPPVSEGAAEALYEQNKTRFAGQPRNEVLARVRSVLEQRAKAQRRQEYEAELRGKASVSVQLVAPRTAVPIPANAPSMGPEAAKVTLVEFTDYQCPFCHRAQAVVDQLLARYQGRLRFVHLDFPLDGHPGAVPAARAARCAGEQEKFWPYHRDLMLAPGLLDDADLKARAAKLGLQAAPFASCIASGRYDTVIQKGLEEGASLGVSGTPAYFVNGRMISGARPLDDFTAVIDAELAAR